MYRETFTTRNFCIKLHTNSKKILWLFDNYLDFDDGKYYGQKINVTFRIREEKIKPQKDPGSSLYKGYFFKDNFILPPFGSRSAELTINPKINLVEARVFHCEDSIKWELLSFVFVKPLRILLARRGLFPLHASLVQKGDTCILMVGTSNSGKSTLGFILSQNGFRLQTDNDCFLRVSGSRTFLFPFPTTMGLKEHMFTRYAELKKCAIKADRYGEKRRVSLKHIYASQDTNYYRNKIILFPKYHNGKRLLFKELTKEEALKRLVRENIEAVPLLRRVDQRWAVQHFCALYALTREARCLELNYNDNLLDNFAGKILRFQSTSKT